jgi:Flp pilus assembly pilin Flp
MLRSANRFWSDEHGAVFSAELVLLSTIVCIGLITGLATFRDQAILELADAADAISELDHSSTFPGITIAGVGSVAGSSMTDGADAGEAGGLESGQADQNGPAGTQCVSINVTPAGE